MGGLTSGASRCAWVLVLSAIAASAAAAQDFRGSITGRVSDSSGGQLPGATVTVTNVATNVGATTTVNTDGNNNANTDPTSAEFGKVTSQNNLPRDIQIAMKLVF